MTGEKTILIQNYKLGNEPFAAVSSHPYLSVEIENYHGKIKNRKLCLKVPKPSIW